MSPIRIEVSKQRFDLVVRGYSRHTCRALDLLEGSIGYKRDLILEVFGGIPADLFELVTYPHQLHMLMSSRIYSFVSSMVCIGFPRSKAFELARELFAGPMVWILDGLSFDPVVREALTRPITMVLNMHKVSV